MFYSRMDNITDYIYVILMIYYYYIKHIDS